LAAGRIHTNTG